MRFNTTKNKRLKLYNAQSKNELDLERKNNTVKKTYVNNSIFKVPKVLYDSGWKSTGEDVGALIPGDGYFYASTIFTAGGTASHLQKTPVVLSYAFIQDIDVPERLLPFIKTEIFVKTLPEVDLVCVIPYNPLIYNPAEYFNIRGDGELIYQGFNPYDDEYSQLEIDNGNLLLSHTSKWYEGTAEYDIGVDHYKIIGRIESLSVWYDTVFVPGANNYNFKHIFTNTIDDLTGTIVLGQGTYQTGTWVNVPPWQLQLSTPLKQTDKTADVTGVGNTATVIMTGQKFKNDVLQPGTDHNFTTIGNWNPGTAVITSWDFAQSTSASGDLFKLHYSADRVRQLTVSRFTPKYILSNMPIISDYNAGGSLPFTTLTMDVNPNPHPLTQDNGMEYTTSKQEKAFGELFFNENIRRDKTRLYINGTILLSVPATENVTRNADFVDEYYTSDGSLYTKGPDNRDPKVLDFFEPIVPEAEVRLVVSVSNPLYYHEIDPKRKQEN